MSALAHILQSYDRAYSQILRPYCQGGNFGQIFDASTDALTPGSWTMFEMGPLMTRGPAALVPAFFYLFRKVEQLFDGSPTLVVLDEFWQYMADPVFARWIQSALKTLRKKNVFLVMATQEVADALGNPLLKSTLLSACPTKIFLADPEATTPAMAAEYAQLGLTPTEIDNLASMVKKRDYYVRSPEGRRIINLELGPVALTFAGMSSPEDQRFLDRMVRQRAPDDYAATMLQHRGVGWAVGELDALAAPPETSRDSRAPLAASNGRPAPPSYEARP